MHQESLQLLEFHLKSFRLGRISFLKLEEEQNSIEETILSYYETFSETSLSLLKLWLRSQNFFDKAHKINGLSFLPD